MTFLCRPHTCEYGDRCLEAHSAEELQEWHSRARASRKKASAAEEQGLLSYQDRLLEEYRSSSNPDHIVRRSKSKPPFTFSQSGKGRISTGRQMFGRMFVSCRYNCDLIR